MSLDLNISYFIYGNLDIANVKLKEFRFDAVLKSLKSLDKKVFLEDKSFPWRFMNNFKILLKFYENFLISGGEEFKNLYNFLYETIIFLDGVYTKKSSDLTNPKKIDDFFSINKIILVNLFKEKITLYVNNNFEGTNLILLDYNNLFKSYLQENGEFLYEYNIAYEESKWTSKWKLLNNENEIVFENVDIYLDTLFKNHNFYYNSSMFNNIKELSSRLDFLNKNCPQYLKILEKKLEKITEKIFTIFPYNIVYNDYKTLLKYNVYKPKALSLSKDFYDELWILSILPIFFSFYLLGFPVVSMDVPETKQLLIFAKKIKTMGSDKYFDWVNKNFNTKYLLSISMGIESGNGEDDGKIHDLCYNEISEYNQDDISCLFSDNVYHCFSSREFRDILKNQENPYNRQPYPNIGKILENIKFKSRLKKSLLSRGLDLDLEGTMKENWSEVFEKIKKKENLYYYPHIESNPQSIYRPILDILFQSL